MRQWTGPPLAVKTQNHWSLANLLILNFHITPQSAKCVHNYWYLDIHIAHLMSRFERHLRVCIQSSLTSKCLSSLQSPLLFVWFIGVYRKLDAVLQTHDSWNRSFGKCCKAWGCIIIAPLHLENVINHDNGIRDHRSEGSNYEVICLNARCSVYKGTLGHFVAEFW